MDKQERKELNSINSDLKKTTADIRAIKYTTEIEWQAEQLDKISKRIKKITGHGTGDD